MKKIRVVVKAPVRLISRRSRDRPLLAASARTAGEKAASTAGVSMKFDIAVTESAISSVAPL